MRVKGSKKLPFALTDRIKGRKDSTLLLLSCEVCLVGQRQLAVLKCTATVDGPLKQQQQRRLQQHASGSQQRPQSLDVCVTTSLRVFLFIPKNLPFFSFILECCNCNRVWSGLLHLLNGQGKQSGEGRSHHTFQRCNSPIVYRQII